MRGIHCWALSSAALELVAGSPGLPPEWFQFNLVLEDNTSIARVSVLDLSDQTAVLEWATRAMQARLTPVLVLSGLEACPDLENDEGICDIGDLLTLRVGKEVPSSIEDAREGLAVPDVRYLQAWAAFVYGSGRTLPSPVTGSPTFAIAYSEALSRWRKDFPQAAAQAAQAVGLDLDGWDGPALCLENLRMTPRKIADRTYAFDIAGHHGVGLIKDFAWRTNGLLPRISTVDPDRFLRNRLDERLTAAAGQPAKEVLQNFDAYYAETFEPEAALHAKPRRQLVPPAWILTSLDSQQWVLRVYAPTQRGSRSPTAHLEFVSDDEGPDTTALNLAFVFTDSTRHWSEPPREFVLTLAAAETGPASAIRCSSVSADRKHWNFHLPARRFVEDPGVGSESAVCIGILVSVP